MNVTDDRLVNDSSFWYNDDSVEIMIDGDYGRGASYDGINDFQLGFRWNDPMIARGANSAPIPPGAVFEIVDTAGGYRLEVALPLTELGIALGYGQLFGLDVHANDDDDAEARDAKIAWWATVDNSSQYPNVFGAGRLEGPQKSHVAAIAQGTSVLLKWVHFAWNDVYEVHGSASPYFTPDETSLIEDVNPPESEYLDTLPGQERYYVIRAKENGLGVNSNRTGKFQFDLIGG